MASFPGHIILITGTGVQSWENMNKMLSERPLSLSWMFSGVARFLLIRPKWQNIATKLDFNFQQHKILRWKQKLRFVALSYRGVPCYDPGSQWEGS